MADVSETSDWNAILEFDSDDPEFTCGFEAGMLWGRLIHEPGITQTVHAANAEMVIRMAEVYGRKFMGEPMGDDWVRVTLGTVPEDCDD